MNKNKRFLSGTLAAIMSLSAAVSAFAPCVSAVKTDNDMAYPSDTSAAIDLSASSAALSKPTYTACYSSDGTVVVKIKAVENADRYTVTLKGKDEVSGSVLPVKSYSFSPIEGLEGYEYKPIYGDYVWVRIPYYCSSNINVTVTAANAQTSTTGSIIVASRFEKPDVEATVSKKNILTVSFPLVENADRYMINVRYRDPINDVDSSIMSYQFSIKPISEDGYAYKPISGNRAVIQFPDYMQYCINRVLVTAANDDHSSSSDEIIARSLTENEENIQDFVDRLYTIILGRHTDPTGLWNWSKKLENKEASAAEIVYGIANSQEFRNHAYSNDEIIEKMYQAMLGRGSDANGKRKWLSCLNNGMTVNAIINGFSGSQEFAGICTGYGILPGKITKCEPRDKNANLTAYVSRMYTKALGRNYDVAGLNSWTEKYLNGSVNAAEIAHGFIFSSEFKGKNLTDEQFVECMYSTLFGRYSDPAGKNGWLTKMANGASREDVFRGFIGAQEFKELVAGFGV